MKNLIVAAVAMAFLALYFIPKAQAGGDVRSSKWVTEGAKDSTGRISAKLSKIGRFAYVVFIVKMDECRGAPRSMVEGAPWDIEDQRVRMMRRCIDDSTLVYMASTGKGAEYILKKFRLNDVVTVEGDIKFNTAGFEPAYSYVNGGI